MEGQTVSSAGLPWGDLIAQGQSLTFRSGQTLIYKDHIPYGAFVILKGRVELIGGERGCGREELRRIPQGEVVGLDSALKGSPSCCDVVASEDCRAVFISKTLLLQHAPA
jgi:CRP-like cAMP-binding protein